MNEVATVFDSCVAEPTQLDLDVDVFQAWTQGIKVPELVSTLKAALLSQYDLDASAAGSGYATLARGDDHSSSSSSSDEDDDDAAVVTGAADDVTTTPRHVARRFPLEDESEATTGSPRLKLRLAALQTREEELASAHAQPRRSDAADGSSSDEDVRRLRLKSQASRRNSAVGSVSGKHGQSHAARSTPLPLQPSPLCVPASSSPPLESERFQGPAIPAPSSIDLVSSNQAQARLLWAWETQLEHQYRMYTLLEHSLKKPFLLNVHYCILQLSFQVQLQLTNLYYDFDMAYMRRLMGLKLSTKTRGTIDTIIERLKEELSVSMLARQQQRRNSQQRQRRSSASQVDIAGGDSSAAALEAAMAGESVRLSSACRQFDNLRRIYRCRWGEKGDGVIDETDLRLDDLEVSGTGLLLPGSSASASERWRNMRAAAVAAMAKRGFGTDKNAALSSAQQRATPLSRTGTEPGTFGGEGIGGGGGLDDFFGFDSVSQPMRLLEQTAPIFFQQQFRLHSSLARRYSRLVFLAHYRIDMSVKRKKPQDLLDFHEVELIAQILMRCWAIPVGACPEQLDPAPNDPTAEGGLSSAFAAAAHSRHTSTSANPALASGAVSSLGTPHVSPRVLNTGAALASSPGESVATSTVNAGMLVPPVISRLATESGQATRRTSVDNAMLAADDDTPEHSLRARGLASLPMGTGAAALGYEFLPIVGQMKEQDEDNWVGDVIDFEFVQGLKDLKGHMSSRVLEEYVGAMARSFREAVEVQVATQSHSSLPLQPITGQQWSAMQMQQTPTAASGTPPRFTHASTLPTHPTSMSSGSSAPTPTHANTVPYSHSTSPQLRSSVLMKLPSKLLPWLRSLHGLAMSLHKSKRIRTLLSDLQEEVLKPLLKLGCNTTEVVYLFKVVREAVVSLPCVARYGIVREANYPHAYERRERPAPAPTTIPEESRSHLNVSDKPRLNATPSTSALGAPPSASSGVGGPVDPLHRSFVHWCRFLDAVGPTAVILYMKMSRANELA